ncbi:MAG: Holliday junction resolvase RuvX [Clostridia bacterium]|nr:Holliday junction resolvase RuvX [Clostridia bacterium]
MQRIMAFDVGEKRVGVAVSDPLGITAQGLETYWRTEDPAADAQYLRALAERYRPVRLVFGLPRNMDGSYGAQAAYTKDFAALVLEGWDGEYDFYDERLSSKSAERVLLEADMSRKKRRAVIDKLAAVVILQGYMEARGG